MNPEMMAAAISTRIMKSLNWSRNIMKGSFSFSPLIHSGRIPADVFVLLLMIYPLKTCSVLHNIFNAFLVQCIDLLCCSLAFPIKKDLTKK